MRLVMLLTVNAWKLYNVAMVNIVVTFGWKLYNNPCVYIYALTLLRKCYYLLYTKCL